MLQCCQNPLLVLKSKHIWHWPPHINSNVTIQEEKYPGNACRFELENIWNNIYVKEDLEGESDMAAMLLQAG